MPTFPLLERYIGHRLDADLGALAPSRAAIVETARRLGREESYGFIHAAWWVWLEDGRALVSVPPGAGGAVADIAAHVTAPHQLFDTDLAAQLRAVVDPVLEAHGLAPTDRTIHSLNLACNAGLLVRHAHGDCRRLTDTAIPAAEGIWFPEHCLRDGIVYGVVADGQIVSVAYAHRSGYLEGQVADVGVETAPAYRGRGYAQTVVSAVVAEVAANSGEALYDPSPENLASIATARSVGFVPYARALALGALAADV